MQSAMIVGALKAVMGPVAKMASALLAEVVIKHMVTSVLDYMVSSYERKAAKTEDKMDDLRAAKLRELLSVVEKQWEA